MTASTPIPLAGAVTAASRTKCATKAARPVPIKRRSHSEIVRSATAVFAASLAGSLAKAGERSVIVDHGLAGAAAVTLGQMLNCICIAGRPQRKNPKIHAEAKKSLTKFLDLI
jgi:hypothetical protein